LGKGEFIRILTEPKNALIKQYIGLMETEGIHLEITEDAIEEIAKIAVLVNERMEDIGARRLFTIMEKILDELSFEAPYLEEKQWRVDAKYVQEKLNDIVQDQDLRKYIL
jgi:ATP-dependent HslUV protease ATP-binding subunit HslU